MKSLIISACLLGTACRYDGKSKPYNNALLLKNKYHLIPVCAEIFGGLPTPRIPCEIRDGRVFNRNGEDKTAEYIKGADEVLRLAHVFDCDTAILKERSPSCGNGEIYDGTFSGRLTDGQGICAKRLIDNRIKVYGESEIENLLRNGLL